MNLSDMGPKTENKKNDIFQPIRPSIGHVSRAGQFNLSSADEGEVLGENQLGVKRGNDNLKSKGVLVRFFVVSGVLILIAGLLGSSVYFYYQYKTLKGDNSKKEISLYVTQLGKIMILPEGEEPTLATVTDKNKLSGQLFFANAQNGDKVLIFSKSGKAILFRPKEKKIVEMMVLSGLSPEQSSGTESDQGTK